MKAIKHKKIHKQKHQKQQTQAEPLPPYLCEAYPVFYGQQQSVSNNYFQENQQMLAEDLAKCEQLLKNFIIGEKEIVAKSNELLEFSCDTQVSFDSGLSFYSCKNILFNEYLICLKFYFLFRLNNADFSSGSALKLYQRLVYLKTLISKLGTVEKKLDYQKNKLLKKGERIKVSFKKKSEQENREQERESEASQSSAQKLQQPQQTEEMDDNLAYKPMVKSLMAEKQKGDGKDSQSRKYVPPKHSSILPEQDKAKRRQERQKDRRKAYLMRRFRGDIEEGDEAEERELFEGVDLRMKKRLEEKEKFEEENFMRLNETKQEKYWKKQMMKNRFRNTMNDELNEIGLIRQLIKEDNVNDNNGQLYGSKIVKKKKN